MRRPSALETVASRSELETVASTANLEQQFLSESSPSSEADQDQLALHKICRKILVAKFPLVQQNDAASVIAIAEPSAVDECSVATTLVSRIKTAVGYVLLGGRILSCLYRFVLVNESIRLFFRVPGLNRWQESPGVIIAADVTGVVLTLADMIQTTGTSKKKVFELCEHPNWPQGICQFFRDICQGEYPVDLLISGLLVCFANGMKGIVGSQNVLHRAAQFPHMENAEKINPISYGIGVSSAICFLAFQWLGQAKWVDRTFKSLKEDSNYSSYLSRHVCWDRGISFIGWLMGIAGASIGAIAACYVNHQFEFHSAFHITLFFVALTAAYFNLFYSYNPIYRLEKLQELHDKKSCRLCLDNHNNINQQVAATPVVIAVEQSPRQIENTGYCSNFFGKSLSGLAALGGSIAFTPAIIRTFQIIFHLIGMATHNQQKYEDISENPWFIFAGTIFSLPFLYLSMLQYAAVWGGKTEDSEEETANRLENNQSVDDEGEAFDTRGEESETDDDTPSAAPELP